MFRTLIGTSIALLLGCAPSLVRTNNVWKYDHYISEMRTHQEMVTVRNWVGIPQSTATVDVDHPVQEVASAPFTGDRLEGYETIVEQRRPSEQQPYRILYLAFVRPVNGFDAVQVAYENSPSAFKDGVGDVRALVRRIRFGDRAFQGTLQSLDRDGAPAQVPAAGAPVEL